jgi:DNA adenine methylase
MTIDPGMKIGGLAPWFGAKRNLATAIVEELGAHRVYWEPFCGSMAVLLAKPLCGMETVNDLNGDLTNLAHVIQHETLGPALYRRLRRTLMNEEMHREAAGRYRDRGYGGDGVAALEAAYDYFLCSWLGRNGVTGTNSYNQGFCVRFTASGGHAATRWGSVIDSIPAWRRRMRNVTVLCRDAFELLPRIDDDCGTAIYCDPPYLVKGAKYVHDFQPADHARLARELARFRQARVVVSYYDHPDLATLYPDWTARKIEITKSLVNQGTRDKGGAVKVTEVLLINGASVVHDDSRPFELSNR